MRTSRTSRSRNPGGLSLVDRDAEVIALVAVCGYITTAQAERACFAGSDAGRKRLRKLYNHGYLQAAISDSRFPTLWSATAKGLQFIESHFGGPVHGARTAGVIRPEGIRHHVGIVDARIALVAMRDLGWLDLVAWHGPRSIAAAKLFHGTHLVCDGLAELAQSPGVPSMPRWLAIEIDTGAESRSVALHKKLTAYKPLLARQTDLELWLVDASTSAIGLAPACLRAGLGRAVRCLRLPDLIERPLPVVPPTLQGSAWPLPANYAAAASRESTSNQAVTTHDPAPARTAAGIGAGKGEA